MTDVHSDSHIVCCFEDVQFHLEEMGISSSIRSGRLIFTKDEIDFRIYFDYDCDYPVKVDNRDTFMIPAYEYTVDGMNDIQEFMCEFLENIFNEYLKVLERVENDQ